MATNVKRKKKKAEVMAEDGSMTLTGHLKELRNRLIICAVVFVVGVVVSLAYADRLIDLLTAMGRDYYEFVSIAPQEKLMQYFRVSILAGVVVTVPVAFYHIYAFARPGLKRSESTFFKLVMLLGLILFCVGVLFAYKLMMPFMLRFLSTGIEGAEYIQTTTSIESYVNLCLTMFIIFGCVFEMPLITIILSKMGIINPQLLKQVRGVAIVIIFFIAAVVTPPDIVSQCMVAGPMVLLYFISILLSGIFYKPKEDDDDEEDDEDEARRRVSSDFWFSVLSLQKQRLLRHLVQQPFCMWKMLPVQSVIAWGRFYGFCKRHYRRICTLLHAQKSTRKDGGARRA